MRVHDNEKLNHCGDDTKKKNRKCLERLSAYTFVKPLGKGAYGATILVAYNTHSLVIKIMLADSNGEEEITAACKIDRLIARDDVIFSRMYGWVQCHSKYVPPDWNVPNIHDECFFLVTEYGNGIPVNRYVFDSLEEFQDFAFELFYALMQANTKHNFRHNDLHTGNVMFLPGPFPSRTYRNVTIRSPGRPMIIDYGLSKFSQDDVEPAKEDGKTVEEYREWLMPSNMYPFKNKDGRLRDVYKFLRFVLTLRTQKPEVQNWLYQTYQIVQNMDSYEAFLVILKPEFQLLFTQAPLIPLCRLCGHAATLQYEHAPSWRLCSRSQCKDRMESIAPLLK